MNAVEWNRDLTQTIEAVRTSEKPLTDKRDRGHGTVTLPEMRRGHVFGCVATLIARVEHNAYSPVAGWRSPEQAWAITQAQRAWYRCMEEKQEMQLIASRSHLESFAVNLQANREGRGPSTFPIAFVLSLEGADSIVELDYVDRLHEMGVRAIGPAHYGPGRYAFGTDSDGSLGASGRELLKKMDELGMILDVTHLCDQCYWEALDVYSGPIWASHQNCRSLVPHNRQFSDQQIQALVNRGGVLGVALDAWMLTPNWVRRVSTPEKHQVTLANVVDHIDRICQIAGNDLHCGIGSDLDGAYGFEQTPMDVNTIADVSGIYPILKQRGFTEESLQRIAHQNFLNFLTSALP
ncbi:MAG: membrane dipeptidase [Planctomycetales bacterium]|nr:membrane dipeptidase [Planctomycetales bacterium]